MKAIVSSLALAAALLVPALAFPQASVEFRVELPVVLPRLVVISPGVQVVPDVDEEVFYTDGYYWVRRDDRWYRSRSHRGGWVYVGPRHVPAGLVRIPPGHYRRWHPGPPGRPAPAAYREDRREHREDRKEMKERWKEERKDAKERGRGRGHGRGHDD